MALLLLWLLAFSRRRTITRAAQLSNVPFGTGRLWLLRSVDIIAKVSVCPVSIMMLLLNLQAVVEPIVALEDILKWKDMP